MGIFWNQPGNSFNVNLGINISEVHFVLTGARGQLHLYIRTKLQANNSHINTCSVKVYTNSAKHMYSILVPESDKIKPYEIQFSPNQSIPSEITRNQKFLFEIIENSKQEILDYYFNGDLWSSEQRNIVEESIRIKINNYMEGKK